MTVVSFASVKGAPGVTTLSCLVAAAWPQHRRVLLVEGDPSGGDLAARFRLSARRGWSSYSAVSRRLDGVEPVAPHLQQLPGGVEVMVSGRSGELVQTNSVILSLLANTDVQGDDRDVVADIGRLLPGEQGAEAWLEHSSVVAVVLRGDAASIMRVRERATGLRSRCHGCVGLVLVGRGSFSGSDIEAFTGLPLLGELPDDRNAAEIAGGRPGHGFRLSRSLLVLSTTRLAAILTSADPSNPDGPAPPKRRTRRGRVARRPFGPSITGQQSPEVTVEEAFQ